MCIKANSYKRFSDILDRIHVFNGRSDENLLSELATLIGRLQRIFKNV